MQETAYAKLNLALHVRGREPDGYHRIETLFAFCADGDTLTIAEGEDLTLEVTGPFAEAIGPPENNLVLRAARALRNRHGTGRGARLMLDKRLPIASGIGGGSADAAAALRLLVRWWGLAIGPEELHQLAVPLGADVPACIDSQTAFGEGRGDRLRPLPSALAGTPVLLANPGVAVPTGPVFRAWDGVDRGPLSPEADLDSLRSGRNDLQEPATALVPEIRAVLNALQSEPGASLVRMSGSGATCFALFGSETERDAAAARLAGRGWWLLPTCLR